MVRLKVCAVRQFVFPVMLLFSSLQVSLSHVPDYLYCRDNQCSAPIASGRFIMDHEDSSIPRDTVIEIIGKSAEPSSTSAVIRLDGHMFVVDSSYLTELNAINPNDLMRVETTGLSIRGNIRNYQVQSSSQQQARTDIKNTEKQGVSISSLDPLTTNNEPSETHKNPSMNLDKQSKENLQAEKPVPKVVDTSSQSESEVVGINILEKDKNQQGTDSLDLPTNISTPSETTVNNVRDDKTDHDYRETESALRNSDTPKPGKQLQAQPGVSNEVHTQQKSLLDSGDFEFHQATSDASVPISSLDPLTTNNEPSETHKNPSMNLDKQSKENQQAEKPVPKVVDTSSQSESEVVGINILEKDKNQQGTDSLDLPTNISTPSETTVNNVRDDKTDHDYRETESALRNSDTPKPGKQLQAQPGVSNEVHTQQKSLLDSGDFEFHQATSDASVPISSLDPLTTNNEPSETHKNPSMNLDKQSKENQQAEKPVPKVVDTSSQSESEVVGINILEKDKNQQGTDSLDLPTNISTPSETTVNNVRDDKTDHDYRETESALRNSDTPKPGKQLQAQPGVSNEVHTQQKSLLDSGDFEFHQATSDASVPISSLDPLTTNNEPSETHKNPSMNLDKQSKENQQAEKPVPKVVDTSSQSESEVVGINILEKDKNQQGTDSLDLPTNISTPSETTVNNVRDDKTDHDYRETENALRNSDTPKPGKQLQAQPGVSNEVHTQQKSLLDSGDLEFHQATSDASVPISSLDPLTTNNEPSETHKNPSMNLDKQSKENQQAEKPVPKVVDTSSQSESEVVGINILEKDKNQQGTDSLDLPTNISTPSETTVNNVGDDKTDRDYRETESALRNSDTPKSGEKLQAQPSVSNKVHTQQKSLLDSEDVSNKLKMYPVGDSTFKDVKILDSHISNHSLPFHVGLIQCIAMAARATNNYKHGGLTENKTASPLSQLLISTVKYYISSADAIITYLPPSLCVHLDDLFVGSLSLPLNVLLAWALFVTETLALYIILRLSLLLVNRSVMWFFCKSNKNGTSDSSEELLISVERITQLSSQLADQEAINGQMSSWSAELVLKLQDMETEMGNRDECLSSMKNELTIADKELLAIEEHNDKLRQNYRNLQTEFMDCKSEFNKERSLWEDQKVMLEDSYTLKLTKLQKEHATAKQEAKEEHAELYSQSMDYYTKLIGIQSQLECESQHRKEVEQKLIEVETDFNNLSTTFSTLKSFEVALENDTESGTYNSDYTLVSTSIVDDATEMVNNDSEADSQNELATQDNEVNDSPNQPQSKIRASLALFLDLGRLRVELESANSRLKTAEAKIKDEQMLRSELETKLEQMSRECAESNLEIEHLNEERISAQTKLDVLTEYFKDREVEFQRDIGKHVIEGSESSEVISVMENRTKQLEAELKASRQQISSLRRELSETKSVSHRQVSELDKRTHDQWLVAKSAEQSAKEMRDENAALRQKLAEAHRALLCPDIKRQQQKQLSELPVNPSSKPRSGGPTTYNHNLALNSSRNSINKTSTVLGSSQLPGSVGLRLPFPPPPMGLQIPVGGIPPTPFIPPTGGKMPFLPGFVPPPPGLLPPNARHSPGSTTGSTSSRYSHLPDHSSMS